LSPALGAQAAESDPERAIAAGDEAMKHYDAGRFSEAAEGFAEADRLYHSPVFVLYQARCKRELGKLLAARALYARLQSEKLPPDAPEPWHRAVAEAGAEKRALAIPTLTLVVTGEGTVELDGEAVAASQLGTPIEIDPGQHEIRARGTDGKSVVETAAVAAGEARELRLDLSVVVAPGVVPPEPAPHSPSAAPRTEGSLLPAALLFGVGGVGLAAGAVTGALALSRADDVQTGCEGSRCYPEAEPLYDEAIALAHASTISLAIGGAATVAGIVLVVVRPGGSDDAAVDARVGPSGLIVTTRF
jgi:tetratricopeptide (TPR) repeat protein